MGGAFNLGRIFGIQFRLHYTWFIIFLVITVSLSWQYFPAVYPEWSILTYWVTGTLTSLLFFSSVVVHELAHSLVGRANGIPVKSITLFIFGGVAQMTREAKRHGAELRMALAGPISSLVIGGFFFLLHWVGGGISEPLVAMAFWLAQVNVVLAGFNLIPGFPLDGGRVFRSLLWQFSGDYQRSTRIATRVGRGVGYLFILVGLGLIFLRPHEWFNGLWLVFIGWFLDNTATTSYRQAQWQGVLQRVRVAEVMTAECPVVPPEATVNYLVRNYILTSGQRCFLVTDGSELKGILTLENIKSVAQASWEATQVKSVMTPVEKLKVAYPEQDTLSVLEQMDENEINQMPVVSEGRVIGLITRENVVRLIRTRSRLGI